MLNSFYLFLIPFLAIIFFLLFKYFINRKKVENILNNAFLNEDLSENKLELTREKVLQFIDSIKSFYSKTLSVTLHWVLHYVVLFLKFISDATDIWYAKVRDFFLKTATKEKEAVSTFWDHLKEYKKEKENEDKTNK